MNKIKNRSNNFGFFMFSGGVNIYLLNYKCSLPVTFLDENFLQHLLNISYLNARKFL